MVRTFFEAFSSGIIDGSDKEPKSSIHPKTVKKIMINHYEHIAPAFLDIMFFPLAAMNFSYEGIEQVVRQSRQQGDDMMSLVRKACGSDELYEAMVAEYKRNFSNLLAGRYASVAEHFETYTHTSKDSVAQNCDSDKAIGFVVRIAMRAYVSGLKRVCVDDYSDRFRQATLFRLLLDAMNVLLGDSQVDLKSCGENLSAMFLKVCLNEHNFNVMTSEMDRTHMEMVD